MHKRVSREGERQRRWRARLGLSSIALLLVFLGCAPSHDPKLQFERAQQVFVRGDLTDAQHQAESGWHYYSGRDPLWAWQFRVLDAKILAWRGMYSEIFAVLSPEFPAPLKNSDLDFRKRELVGVAYVGTHKFREAENILAELSRDCRASGSEVTGEVLSALGSLPLERGEYQRAQEIFEESLRLAREQGNRFSEAVALLKLSNTALQQ
jgi:tetratricopeptide (TPR) repeat protein